MLGLGSVHPARLVPSSTIGLYQSFITLCTHGRRRFFLEQGIVRLVELQLFQNAIADHFEVSAYCFMPDHLHALVAARVEAADLYRFVKSVKQMSSFHFKASHGEVLWQRSFFDRTLRGDEGAWDVIRYIVSNPVRAGLVSSAAEYAFWGSQVYTRQQILEFIETART